jgi:WD40 repeat protein
MRRAVRFVALSVLVATTVLAPAITVTASGAAASVAAPGHAVLAQAGPAAVPGGTRLWVHRFTGGTGMAGYGTAVAASPDRSVVYVTGTTQRTPQGDERTYATVAYDAVTGAQLWVARYHGSGHIVGNDAFLKVSPDGSKVFVAGELEHQRRSLVLALSALTGALLWSAEPTAGTCLCVVAGLAVSPDSSAVYVTGLAGVGRSPTAYVTFALFARTGTVDWTADSQFPQQRAHLVSAITVSPDGAAVFVSGEPGTVALSAATGATLWQDHYKYNWGRFPDQMTVSPDSSMIFVASPAGTRPSADRPFLTAAYNATTGARVWAARYTGSAANRPDFPVAIAVSPDGSRVFVTGRVFKANGTQRFQTLGYDAATGAQLWSASYPGVTSQNTIPEALAVSPDSSKVFVTGFTSVGYLTIGYDTATGAQAWKAQLAGVRGAFTIPLSIAVGRDSSRVFVTGSSTSPLDRGPSEYLTVAYGA